MSSYAETDYDRRIANVVMFGRVKEIDPARGVARVDFDGADTDWIPWATPRAGGDRMYWCPEVGEQVVVAAVGGDLGNAAIIGCLFQDAHPEAADNADTHRTVYKDGTVVEYDRSGHVMNTTLNPAGTFNVTVGASKITMNQSRILFSSNGSTLEIDAAGIRLNGAEIHLN